MKAISKALALILRHKAESFNIAVRPDAFCELNEVLNCFKMRKLGATRAIVEQAVRTNAKRRFEIRDICGRTMIRALQGHSMKRVRDEDLLRKMELTDELPQKCVHGTYQKYWRSIEDNGLLVGGTALKGERNHIHFAPYDYDDKEVILGMRKDCDVAIYLDLRKALAAGIPFYMSENLVILTTGVEGKLSCEFFVKAINFRTGRTLLDNTEDSACLSVKERRQSAAVMKEKTSSSEDRSSVLASGEDAFECVDHEGCHDKAADAQTGGDGERQEEELGTHVSQVGECSSFLTLGDQEMSKERLSGDDSKWPCDGKCNDKVAVAIPERNSKRQKVISERWKKNIKVRESTRRRMMSFMKGDNFLSENTEHLDKMHLLRCEQKSIGLTYRLNMFNQRGTMRKKYKLLYMNSLKWDWRITVCQYCKRGPSSKWCSQCGWLCCSRCIEKKLYGQCWKCLGYESAGGLGRERKRLEEWRKAQQRELVGPSKMKFHEGDLKPLQCIRGVLGLYALKNAKERRGCWPKELDRVFQVAVGLGCEESVESQSSDTTLDDLSRADEIDDELINSSAKGNGIADTVHPFGCIDGVRVAHVSRIGIEEIEGRVRETLTNNEGV